MNFQELKAWKNETFRHKVRWSSAEMRQMAWKSVMKNYKNCVIVSLALGIACYWMYYLYNPGLILTSGFSGWRKGLSVKNIIALVFLALNIFVLGPLEVGCRRFYVENEWGEKPDFHELTFVFHSGYYWNVVKVMLVRNFVIYLGCLLLVVPGVYFMYRYKLVPYLLAEQPGMKLSDATTISSEMMNGQKWDAFLLDLSFWPYIIGAMLTWGIVGVLVGWPYRHAANAELYLELIDLRYRRT